MVQHQPFGCCTSLGYIGIHIEIVEFFNYIVYYMSILDYVYTHNYDIFLPSQCQQVMRMVLTFKPTIL